MTSSKAFQFVIIHLRTNANPNRVAVDFEQQWACYAVAIKDMLESVELIDLKPLDAVRVVPLVDVAAKVRNFELVKNTGEGKHTCGRGVSLQSRYGLQRVLM
jgi:hypothetical protein